MSTPFRIRHLCRFIPTGIGPRSGRGIGWGVVLLCGALLAGPVMADADKPGHYADRADVRSFVRQAADQTGVSVSQIRQWVDGAQYQQSIIDAITRPAEAKPWPEYRAIFITPKRIAAGVAFWDAHAEALRRVSQHYGVSPAIILGIVGVETYFGQHVGHYRVIDSLATLGFDYPARGAFFRKQLIDFIKLAGEEHLDINQALGSYAGAMGLPQFIPSSYLAYAVDGDGDGRRDLWHSDPDVFASVSNYFVKHGWGQGEPVAFRVRIGQAKVDDLLNTGRDLAPKTTIGQLRSRGVAIPADVDVPDDFKVMLFTLTGPQHTEYWVGLNNFYVITRYNHSVLYAMAVWQLSQAIRQARAAERPPTASKAGHAASPGAGTPASGS